MAMPGISEESEVRKLLKKLLESPDASMFFAVAASAPKEGRLVLSKTKPLKRKDVQEAAEAEAKEEAGKPVRMDVIAGECRLEKAGSTVLRLMVYGKAAAKAVSCADHLLVRGPFKIVGFTGVVLEESEESSSETSPSPPETPPSLSPGEVSDEAAQRFNARLKELLPRIKEAAGTRAGDEAKLAASEAGVIARKQQFEEALRLLDRAESALVATGSTAPEEPRTGATSGGPSLVLLQKSRLAWDQTRKTIQAELQKLERSILASCEADDEVGVGALDVGALHSVLQRLDTRLIDKLDEALNAQDSERRAELNREAKAIVEEYLEYVNDSDLMADIDDSGFVPVAIRKTALSALTVLAGKL